MKRAIILIQLLLVVSLSNAQIFSPQRSRTSSPVATNIWKYRRWEVTVGAGTAHLYGDIGGYSRGSNVLGLRDISFKNIRFNVAGSLRYMINNDFGLRLNVNITGLHEDDSKGSNEARGLKSSTFIIEPDILAEYNVIKSSYDGVLLFNRGRKFTIFNLLNTFNLYGFAGVGGSVFKVDHNTSPLASGTYSNGGLAATFPAGVCINMSWNARTSFGVELGFRYALSDYIDGYHSHYSRSNDIWHTITFTYSYKLRTGPRGWPSFGYAGEGRRWRTR